MLGINLSLQTSLGPLIGPATMDGSSTLSTTVTKVVLPDPGMNTQSKYFRCLITNRSASNMLAYVWVPAGSTAPVFTTTPGTTCGCIVLPMSNHSVTFLANVDLYVVGSASSTIWSITTLLQ